MKLKSGDQVMHEGEMYTVVNVSRSMVPSYVLLDDAGEPHPDSPFSREQQKEWPVV